VELVEGQDWRPLSPPQPSSDGTRIEVLEFFSYGCPHCGQLNPLIGDWAKGLPADVAFQRVPVTFGRAAWANLARVYFALQLDGTLERLDQQVFDAVGKQRVNLYTDKAIRDWVAKQGLDGDAFGSLLYSFAVEAALTRAETLAERFRVDAVPMIVVDGRYVVVGSGARGYQDLLRIADGLIKKARQQRAQG
jgi:thiol:disulfide interchange protein DsbA